MCEALSEADCLIMMTDYTEFKSTNLKDIKALMPKQSIIVDGRRIDDAKEAAKLGLCYFGLDLGLIQET